MSIPRERLKDWLTREYIVPSIQKASGQGTKNLFSLMDLYLIKLFEYLLARGFARKDAQKRVHLLSLLTSYGGRVSKRLLSTEFLGIINSPDDNEIIIKNGYEFDKSSPSVVMLSIDDNGRISTGLPMEKLHLIDDMLIVNFAKIRNEVDVAVI